MLKIMAIIAATISFNNGDISNTCGKVSLSPYADKETIAAALNDAAIIVQSTGCVNITLDDKIPSNIHFSN